MRSLVNFAVLSCLAISTSAYADVQTRFINVIDQCGSGEVETGVITTREAGLQSTYASDSYSESNSNSESGSYSQDNWIAPDTSASYSQGSSHSRSASRARGQTNANRDRIQFKQCLRLDSALTFETKKAACPRDWLRAPISPLRDDSGFKAVCVSADTDYYPASEASECATGYGYAKYTREEVRSSEEKVNGLCLSLESQRTVENIESCTRGLIKFTEKQSYYESEIVCGTPARLRKLEGRDQATFEVPVGQACPANTLRSYQWVESLQTLVTPPTLKELTTCSNLPNAYKAAQCEGRDSKLGEYCVSEMPRLPSSYVSTREQCATQKGKGYVYYGGIGKCVKTDRLNIQLIRNQGTRSCAFPDDANGNGKKLYNYSQKGNSRFVTIPMPCHTPRGDEMTGVTCLVSNNEINNNFCVVRAMPGVR